MYEIRLEIVEVDKPGGEIIGIPLIAQRTNTVDNPEMVVAVFNNIVDTIIDGEIVTEVTDYEA